MEEAQSGADDSASQFDQDFAVMSLQINELVRQLLEALGGKKAS